MLTEWFNTFGLHRDTVLIGLSLHAHLLAVWMYYRKIDARVSVLEALQVKHA